MPLTSASPLRSRLATVFEFVPALARRHLAQRIGCRLTLHVYATADGTFTLATQHRVTCGREPVENRFAQLRASTGGYQLFWKNGSGRWTAYSGEAADGFTGSIDECLSEIARDPHGCYWS
jgi:hypothetical protein